MRNRLVRVLSKEANVRGLACETTELVNEACRLHGTSPTASAALGRALTGAALMGALLKRNQQVGLKFEGQGPLKKIIAEADERGAVRGLVAVPGIDIMLKEGKLDVAGALGNEGFLTVIRDEGLKEPYQGVVRLRTGEIAEDLAYYFTESEQIPTAVGLGVFVEPGGRITAAGGFLIQALPPSDDAMVDRLVDTLEQLPPVTEMLRTGKRSADLLAAIFGDIPYVMLETRDLRYECSCSRERIEKVLVSLGPEELDALIAEDGQAEVTCEFCRRTYHFTEEDLRELRCGMVVR